MTNTAISTHTPRERRDISEMAIGIFGLIISTHTPRERRDSLTFAKCCVERISTHTPRERRDLQGLAVVA